MWRRCALLSALVFLFMLFPGCGDDARWTAGTIENGVYANEALSLTFQIPEDWSQTTPEAVQDLLPADLTEAEVQSDLLLASGKGDTVLLIAGVPLSQDSDTADNSASDAKALEAAMLDTLRETLENSDTALIFRFRDREDIQLSGIAWRCVDAAVSDGTFRRFLVRQLTPDWMGVIAVSAPSVEMLDACIARFTSSSDGLPDLSPAHVFSTGEAFSRGIIQDDRYASAYLGLEFTLPEGWAFTAQEILDEQFDITFDWLGDELYGDKVDQAEETARTAAVTDMAAAAPDGMSSVQITLEDLFAGTDTAFFTAEDYAQTLEQQLSSITEFTYQLGGLRTDELAGQRFTVLETTVPEFEIRQDFYLLRLDRYMLCITLTGTEAAMAELAGCFAPI